jgi:hypothetical protein
MRIIALSILVSLCVVSFVFAEEQAGQAPLGLTPILSESVGTTAITKKPAKYPIFDNSSDNNTCDAYLETSYDGVNNGVTATNGLSLAPLWLGSKYGNGTGGIYPQSDVAFQWESVLAGEVNIPANYRQSAKVIVTWTVRIEGSQVYAGMGSPPGAGYKVWPKLCSWWHGTSNQNFSAGQVKTALFVEVGSSYVKKSEDIYMTIPSAGAATVVQPNDPTHTGSCILTKEDFGGTLPAVLRAQVRWYNDTTMQLNSPAYMRNLIINVVPVE